MSTRLEDLQGRRDGHAVRVYELQQQLDSLTGLEEIRDVQRLSDELAAAVRLLAALDRQIETVQQALRAEALAERETRRSQATKQAGQIDADVRRLLLQVYDLVERREDVTAEFSELAITSTRMRQWTIDMLRASGVQFQTSGLGHGVQPVRR